MPGKGFEEVTLTLETGLKRNRIYRMLRIGK
jgi:hypothetical protein